MYVYKSGEQTEISLNELSCKKRKKMLALVPLIMYELFQNECGKINVHGEGKKLHLLFLYNFLSRSKGNINFIRPKLPDSY
jgi:hypothetical protein